MYTHVHTHVYAHVRTRTYTHISSDAHDFDLCIKLSGVLIVTAFHKSILPTLEFSLGEREVSSSCVHGAIVRCWSSSITASMHQSPYGSVSIVFGACVSVSL